MQMLGQLSQDRPRPALVPISAVHPAVRRHARLRVVRAGADLCVQHHALLRGHPPGQEQAAQADPLLDQLCLLFDLCHRDVAQVGRPGVYQVLLQLLDDTGLYHRIRTYFGGFKFICHFFSLCSFLFRKLCNDFSFQFECSLFTTTFVFSIKHKFISLEIIKQ